MMDLINFQGQMNTLGSGFNQRPVAPPATAAPTATTPNPPAPGNPNNAQEFSEVFFCVYYCVKLLLDND